MSRQEENRLADEWFARWTDCLHAAGIETAELPDGGTRVLADEDTEAFQRLDRQCQEQSGPQPTFAPITVEEARQLYQWDLATMQCLTEQGYHPTAPSSEQEYVDKYLSMQAPWSPYNGIEDIAGAQAACPEHLLGQD